MEYILFLILGGLISVLSGFFGVGGGFILTPTLLLIGFPPIEAIVTSLMFTIGTSLFGIYAHIRLKNIHWREGCIVGISGVVSTQNSKPFVLYIEDLGWDEFVIPIFYILLLSYFAIKLFMEERRTTKQVKRMSSSPSFFKMVLIGLIGGVVSSVLGVGGGFIIVPLLITMLHFPPKKAVGTSLFAVLMIVSVGFASYALSVSFDYRVGGLLIIGALLGSQFGASLTALFENKEINHWLGILYIVTLTSVVLKLLHLNRLGLVILGLFMVVFLAQSILRIKGEKGRKVKSIV